MDTELSTYDRMMKGYANDQAEKESYPTACRQHGEQFMGMTPWYWIAQDKSHVRVHIETFKQRTVSKTVTISYQEYIDRPQSGPEKREAKWALELCGVEL